MGTATSPQPGSGGGACEDTDGDGILDANDLCPTTYTYGPQDTDGDGLADDCADSDDDNDGITDANDGCPTVPGQFTDDRDGDSIPDACDKCPDTTNSRPQVDADGDGRPAACDPDRDGDGTNDEADNCPDVPNPYQSNIDGDAAGDACDEESIPPLWLHRGRSAPREMLVEIPDFGALADGTANNFGETFPIDVCKRAICRDVGYVPEGYRMDIELEAGFNFRAAIIDGRGNLIARMDPGELTYDSAAGTWSGTIGFEPVAGAFFLTDAVGAGILQLTTYRLRVYGNPEFSGLNDEMLLDVTATR